MDQSATYAKVESRQSSRTAQIKKGSVISARMSYYMRACTGMGSKPRSKSIQDGIANKLLYRPIPCIIYV
jgi:hypothetical protein